MYCRKCGQQIDDYSKFCQYCGASQRENSYNNDSSSSHVYEKNKWIALLLCIFLGVLGIHRFYVGKIGTGILYLFTGGLFGIGWIVDIILILVGSFTDKSGNFLHS